MAHLETMVPVPGGQLFAVADGDGPPIVLIHAGIADMRAWDPVVPRLVEAGYRAVRYDMRGFGRSTTEDVAFARWADTIAVLDTLGVQRAALVGNSMGGMAALDVALEAPGRVVAVGLVASGVGGFDGEDTPEEIAAWEEIRAADEAGDGDRVAALEVRLWVDGVNQPETRVDRAIRDLVYEMDRPVCQPGHVGGRAVAIDPPANARLRELAMPILAVAGGLDVLSARQAAERVGAEVRDARVVVMPGVAHMIGMERPAELADLILDLVRPLGTWS